MKKNSRFNFVIDSNFNNQLDKIIKETKETKSDVIRRLVQNEYARIENNPDGVIELKQTQIEDIKASIVAGLKLNDRTHGETQKVMASLYLLHKNVLRILFFVVRALFNKLNIAPNELKELNELSYQQAGKSMVDIEKYINKGLTASMEHARREEIQKD